MSETLLAYQRSTYAVWEITLKCNLACSHCGSRAGDARPNELSTDEALDLVRQLDEAGVKEVTLIGGEAYLRKDWLEIAAEITRRGMVCTVTTGGLGVSAHMAAKMKAAGIASVSLSIDGLEATHDRLRGVPGSWNAAIRALQHLREAGIQIAVNTQINRRTWLELEALYELLQPTGAHGWQVQLTVPMGNAADDSEVLLQPYELLDLFPRLAALAERGRREGFRMAAGNNVGYFGPYEGLLRSLGTQDAHWQGCQAGVSTLGIEADGAIKGCPSLPTGPYTGANIRDLTLAQIIEQTEPLNFIRRKIADPSLATEDLWGFCKGCYYADVCRAGCNWTAHVFFGKRGNNPYCHHRALEQQARGVRERLVQVAAAPGAPFDHGLFEIVEEPWG
ncbi:MAG: putative Fe-S oxidoreductase [Cyanobacteria bacterium RYN_339]|nr:putative Fe-S oxidoreductase [Cyanobacteria bacterium RYN_339]